jgi:hypothetical protein
MADEELRKAVAQRVSKQEEDPQKWGNWFISTMPGRVLLSAIADTDAQLARVSERLANNPQHARAEEFAKTKSKLKALSEALASEKARRHG